MVWWRILHARGSGGIVGVVPWPCMMACKILELLRTRRTTCVIPFFLMSLINVLDETIE